MYLIENVRASKDEHVTNKTFFYFGGLMQAITGIIQTAVIVLVSVGVLIAAGAGLYMYFTVSGQEEGE